MLATAAAVTSKLLQRGPDDLEAARRKLNEELANEQKKWSDCIASEEANIRDTTAQLAEVEETKLRVKAELQGAKQELDKGPSVLLREFLQQRLEAAEYQKNLGVPAIIRRDFKDLTELVKRQNEAPIAGPSERQPDMQDGPLEEMRPEDNLLKETLPEEDDRVINRIILYIDDLDRCPDDKVVGVLQAVHLLLAFPLFVVVVAVDSRWLAHALRTTYPALAGVNSTRATSPDTARPDDYLEKIFQIPFWVSPLTVEARGRIVRGLFGTHVLIGSPSLPPGQVGPVQIGAEEELVLREMLDPRSGPPLLDVTALTVTPVELAFLNALAELMGGTPRSVKRFVNVYQLVKILRRGRALVYPPDEHVLGFLLALAEGLPELGWRLFEELEHATVTTKLSSVLEAPSFRGCPGELKILRGWLNLNQPFADIGSDRLAELAAEVRRFIFRITPHQQPDAGVGSRQVVHFMQHADPGGGFCFDPVSNTFIQAPVTTAKVNQSAEGAWHRTNVTVELSAVADVGRTIESIEYWIVGGQPTKVDQSSAGVSVTTDGETTISFKATDTGGVSEAVKTTTIRIDRTAPVSVVNLQGGAVRNGWFSAPVTICLSATDQVSGVASTSFSTEVGRTWNAYDPQNPPVFSDDGTHRVLVQSIDIAGNLETPKHVEIKVDRQPPRTVGNPSGPTDADGWYRTDGPITLELTGTDTESGLASTSYTLNGGPEQVYTGPIPFEPGEWNVQYWSTDKAGNAEIRHSLVLKVRHPAQS